MVFNVGIGGITLLCQFLVIRSQVTRIEGNSTWRTAVTQDQTSSRSNTLFDDADDIQKQLDNEARDRIKYGKPKAIWVFKFPTQYTKTVDGGNDVLRRPRNTGGLFDRLDARKNKHGRQIATSKQLTWPKLFPSCGGRLQSPVDLPVSGIIKARGARNLQFCNYDAMPKTLTLVNDGQRMILYGKWEQKKWPLVYGGAAHSRRYLFHSLTLHWPSEHSIGSLFYPMETQALHVSADYGSFDEAVLAAASDSQAFLGIVNIYKFGKSSQGGLKLLVKKATELQEFTNKTISPRPLSAFNPSFKEYACYQGSLTHPPCTESVLWLVRRRALSVVRDVVYVAHKLFKGDEKPKQFMVRQPQPLNDRRIFLFNN